MRMIAALAGVVLATALAGCGERAAAPDDLNGRWVVQEIAGEGIETNGALLLMINSADGEIDGRTGCNAFTATIQSFGQSITIGNVVATDSACTTQEAQIDQERFLRVLPSVRRYVRNGRRLELLPQAAGAEALILARGEG